MFNREIFATRLKALRETNGLSTQKLATALGLKSKGGITQFEKAMTSPSADTLVAMSNYFNVSLDYLAGLSDKPERK
ncbi:transcriptional regulator with XRE-family HTH domain [Sporomusaceae bacterium BoRhaA]|uniref:helix-turn-helix domain-containing protein n=1 Tax=Pelorhabdus rhamnosifermentans TaxID=2772457 RepID=UPI001C060497|nr:helix-turn-helix transcriptional regulator [Pelorhabdus rhamnosifermentans]MBU2703376.1 transcriptional regulator with XRE-family HTH domain [Pelorhabdus rhamnosifermentans]